MLTLLTNDLADIKRGQNNKRLTRMSKSVFNLTPFQLRIFHKLKLLYRCKSNSELIRYALEALANASNLTEIQHPDFKNAIHEKDSNIDYNIDR